MSEKKEFLYVMGTESVIELCDSIKIGITKDVEQRRRENGSSFEKLECYYTRPGTKEDETKIHKDLAKFADHSAESRECFRFRDPESGFIEEDVHTYLIEQGFVEYEAPEEEDGAHGPAHPDGWKIMLETMINGWNTNMSSIQTAIGARGGSVSNWLSAGPRAD